MSNPSRVIAAAALLSALSALSALAACSAPDAKGHNSDKKAENKLEKQEAKNQAAYASSDVSTATSAACDASLWNHVYNPSRLQRLNDCISATGIVNESLVDDDGDQHFLLTLDPGQDQLLKKKNMKKKGGGLVVEIVCANPVKLKKVKAVCAGYTNKIPIPPVGSHVKVTGTYVIDTHNGWAEIHPVSTISSIK